MPPPRIKGLALLVLTSSWVAAACQHTKEPAPEQSPAGNEAKEEEQGSQAPEPNADAPPEDMIVDRSDRFYLGFIFTNAVPPEVIVKVSRDFNDSTHYPSNHCQRFINSFIRSSLSANAEVYYAMHDSFILLRAIQNDPVSERMEIQHLALWEIGDDRFILPQNILKGRCEFSGKPFQIALF